MELAYTEKIGAGAFADVWLAEDLELGRKVAVKFFRDADPAVHRKVALDHAKALARVQHPSVVAVFGIELQKHPESGRECLTIIMEHVEGVPLSKHAERFSLASAQIILTNLAEALDAIHVAGMIHDDFHEGNIMITPHGAKVLDILYTRSLAEVGTRTAHGDRQADIRAYAKLARLILERTDQVDGRRILDAHYKADRASTARVALEEFRMALDPRESSGSASTVASEGGSRSGVVNDWRSQDLYLVWMKGRSESGGPNTQIYALGESGSMISVASLKNAYYVSSGRLWELRTGTRGFRILSGSVLEHWYQDGSEYVTKPGDYVLATIPDMFLASHPDGLIVPLASSDPAPLSSVGCFEYERSVLLLGAVGPYVFVEEHDYTFGGGAHGGVGSRFRLIDIESLQIFDSPAALFVGDEAGTIEKHGAVAKATLLSLRGDALLFEHDLDVTLVSARPHIRAYGPGDIELLLKFSASTYYAASDHKWSSYTISEEVLLRVVPSTLAPYVSVPASLLAALGGDAALAIGWSRMAVDHPLRGMLVGEIERARQP